MTATTDYESLAFNLLVLLDLAEAAASDAKEVRRLCAQRFDVVERFGLKAVVNGFDVSDQVQ